jgi:hypothetical protein
MTPVTREACYQAATELRHLLPLVHALIYQPDTVMAEPGTRHTATLEVAPWNDPAADVYFDIHAGVRHHETALSLLLFGHAKFRPGSDTHTMAALERLPILIAHALDKHHDDDQRVRTAGGNLTAWPVTARRLLGIPRDDERPWTKAPGDLRCPYCGNRLALAPGWESSPQSADVICRHCRDEHGRWYRWAPSLWTGMVLDER